jgi:putative membrane protein
MPYLRYVVNPVFVWCLFCGCFIFWHLPGPYDLALRYETLHAVEHLSLLAVAFAFWSFVIAPSGRRRIGYGQSLLFVATAAVLSGLPGALMTLQ